MTSFSPYELLLKPALFNTLRIFCLLLCVNGFIQAQHHDHGSEANGVNHVLACRTGVNFVDNLPPAILMDGVGHST